MEQSRSQDHSVEHGTVALGRPFCRAWNSRARKTILWFRITCWTSRPADCDSGLDRQVWPLEFIRSLCMMAAASTNRSRSAGIHSAVISVWSPHGVQHKLCVFACQCADFQHAARGCETTLQRPARTYATLHVRRPSAYAALCIGNHSLMPFIE
jgi:hypothetical protein